MKNKRTKRQRPMMVIALAFTLAVLLPSLCLAGGSGIYIKVITADEMEEIDDGVVTATCDNYTDHLFTWAGDDPAYPADWIVQHDPILGVSVLCPGMLEDHLDPVVHLDGFEDDFIPHKDIQDGLNDTNVKAVVYCRYQPDSGYPPQSPDWQNDLKYAPERIILECLDHKVLEDKKQQNR